MLLSNRLLSFSMKRSVTFLIAASYIVGIPLACDRVDEEQCGLTGWCPCIVDNASGGLDPEPFCGPCYEATCECESVQNLSYNSSSELTGYEVCLCDSCDSLFSSIWVSEKPQCSCENKACGDDGCGNSCGQCPAGWACIAGEWEGQECQCDSSCDGLSCGENSCGESCGECQEYANSFCNDGACDCAIDCLSAVCGNDGCGGNCGECSPTAPFCLDGDCFEECQPDCDDAVCGDDGCGGSCGDCPPNGQCADGQCVCTSIACGGECCADKALCYNGACCVPANADNAECGDDGCGGFLGLCDQGLSCDPTLNVCVPAGWLYIPPGSFPMGSLSSAECSANDELPCHAVGISHGLLVSDHELTVKEVGLLLASPVKNHFGIMQKGTCKLSACPVETVSWYDSLYLANLMSEKQGLPACYGLIGCAGKPGAGCANGGSLCENLYHCEAVDYVGVSCQGYRLPTEAEWEYLARANSTSAFSYPPPGGSEASSKCLPEGASIGEFAWAGGNADGTTHPTVQKAANAWALFDTAGNVSEWVWDTYSLQYYGDSSVNNPSCTTGSNSRVVRGGSWDSLAEELRAAARSAHAPGLRSAKIGVRFVRTILVSGPCTPACDGKPCGPDGCGGKCGTCGANEICNGDYACVPYSPCVPDCADKTCGEDGCGGSCGTCPALYVCEEVETASTCQPDCDGLCQGKSCGTSGKWDECICGTCDDGNTCTSDFCEANFVCDFKPNLLPCDDSDLCTSKDLCNGSGQCVGTPKLCDDGDVCNGEEQCDPDSGECVSIGPVDCDDGDPCTDDACVPVVGCTNTESPDGTLCGDDASHICFEGVCGYVACGNGDCEPPLGETCNTCPADCGPCD